LATAVRGSAVYCFTAVLQVYLACHKRVKDAPPPGDAVAHSIRETIKVVFQALKVGSGQSPVWLNSCCAAVNNSSSLTMAM
jgi:hypothetical protein